MEKSESEVVEAFISAINRHDIAALSLLMAPDHAFVDATGKTQSGREGMIAGWTEYFHLFPDYEIQVERILALGPVAAVFGSACGTYRGKRGLIAENKIAMPAAWKAIVEKGQIKLWQVYADWTQGWEIIRRDSESG